MKLRASVALVLALFATPCWAQEPSASAVYKSCAAEGPGDKLCHDYLQTTLDRLIAEGVICPTVGRGFGDSRVVSIADARMFVDVARDDPGRLQGPAAPLAELAVKQVSHYCPGHDPLQR